MMRGLAALAFTITFTINLVYQVTMVGLNPLQLVLVGTTIELTVFIFEVPTGVVADVYSRRLSVILGYVGIGLGFLVVAIPTFAMVLLGQVIWGLGYTFFSGASDAWIVDEIGEEVATPLFVRAEQLSLMAGFVGILISVGVAMQFQLNTPHLISGGLLIMLSIMLAFIMPEKGFERVATSERETWRDLFKTLGDGIKLIQSRRILLLIVLTSLMVGFFSEGWDRLWTAHFLTNFGLPPATENQTLLLFGAMSLVGSVLGLVASEALRRMQLSSNRQLATGLGVLYAAVGIGVIIFANVSGLWVAVVMLWFVGTMRALTNPLYVAWINKNTTSNVRATVLSFGSQANALGQFTGGPFVGWIGVISGLRVAITLTGALILPTVLLAWNTSGYETKTRHNYR